MSWRVEGEPRTPVLRASPGRTRALSTHARRLSEALGMPEIHSDEDALSIAGFLASYFGGSKCFQGLPDFFGDTPLGQWGRGAREPRDPAKSLLSCFASCLGKPDAAPAAPAPSSEPLPGAPSAAPLKTDSSPDAWLGHWVMSTAENDKADAAMKKQGLPYLIRKLLLRWRAERKFHLGEAGQLVLNSKSLTGGWIVISSTEGTTEVSSYFGYEIKSVMSWEGAIMVTSNYVTDPSGVTKLTLSRHWLDGDTLVNSTYNETDGEYKVWFVKKTE